MFFFNLVYLSDAPNFLNKLKIPDVDIIMLMTILDHFQIELRMEDMKVTIDLLTYNIVCRIVLVKIVKKIGPITKRKIRENFDRDWDEIFMYIQHMIERGKKSWFDYVNSVVPEAYYRYREKPFDFIDGYNKNFKRKADIRCNVRNLVPRIFRNVPAFLFLQAMSDDGYVEKDVHPSSNLRGVYVFSEEARQVRVDVQREELFWYLS